MNTTTENPSKSDLGPTALVITWLLTALASTIVGFRFWVRAKIVRSFNVDDWAISITLALALVNAAILTKDVHSGLGKHIESLSPEEIGDTVKWAVFCVAFGVMSPCFGRISFALLLLRIIPPVPWRRRFLQTIIACQFIVDIAVVVINYAQCRPLEKYWNPGMEGSCWSPKVQQYTGYLQGSVCSLVDLMLAIFPASLFWNLNMEWKAKLSLSILMGLGFFAMIASIIKTVELRGLAQKDVTHTLAKLILWWTVEGYLVLIAASIPTLRPLFFRTGNSTAGTDTTSGKSSSWPLSHLRSKPRNMVSDISSTSHGGPFVQLDGNASSEIGEFSNGQMYKYKVSTGVGGGRDRIDQNGIKKDTITEVTYEHGVLSGERNLIGRG